MRPGLVVPLRGLTPEGVKNVFMEIEMPAHAIPGQEPGGPQDPTIGEFYDAIKAAYVALPDGAIDGTGSRQLALDIPIINDLVFQLFKITAKADAERAVNIIKEQGEGTANSPFDPSKHLEKDLAHYFRFAELHHGHELVVVDGNITYTGAAIDFPAAFPMAAVPAGGYAAADVAPDVQAKLKKFDENFSEMLAHLHAAWRDGDAAALDGSVSAMFSLRGPARQLMQIPLPAGGGNYGPCFRVVEVEA